MALLKHLWRSERARHALIAAGIAAVLGAVEFFEPLRPIEWQAQAYIAPRQASGEIVFIEEKDYSGGPNYADIRKEIADLIAGLTEAGARKILLNDVFDRPSTPDADEALATAIAQSQQTTVAQHSLTTVTGEQVRSTLPEIAGLAPQAIQKQQFSPFGYVWFERYAAAVDGALLPTLPALLAERVESTPTKFAIDYSIDNTSIPTIAFGDAMNALTSGRGTDMFADKAVVIGKGVGALNSAAIPGIQHVPPSIVTILAAETLMIGPPAAIGWFLPWLLVSACLIAAVLKLDRARSRRSAYVFALTLPVLLLFIFAHLRLFSDLATSVALLALFATLRLWHLRQHKASLTDGLTGLPSFRRLEQDLRGQKKDDSRCAVVVAKVHRFDEVLSSLQAEHQGEYVRLIANRLRIADEDLVIYSNGGRYLAWLQKVEDEEQLCTHLNGLRAVFTHPLNVAGTAVDVGITFGADATSEPEASRKIAAAASTAEKTTEAHSPVLLARASSADERLWNVSLQAKIDQALKSGDIYVVYQPQFDLRSGAMLGVEALVRWNDRDRGQISPSYFIEQCEQVGRMDALTKKVLHDAIASTASADSDLQLSINVSAILLRDLRVVEMVQEELSLTGVSPDRLTIEITETSRIKDYGIAREVMDHLHSLGVRLSIDDFGVGAASLETLLVLPFDELKIDRMFVSQIRHSAKARHIVESLIRLGHHLDIAVIAEGVEDGQTLAALKEANCGGAQGYYLATPGPFPHPIDAICGRAAL